MPYLVRQQELGLTIVFPVQLAMLLSLWMKLSKTGRTWSLISRQVKIETSQNWDRLKVIQFYGERNT
jgi:hypothetical protein